MPNESNTPLPNGHSTRRSMLKAGAALAVAPQFAWAAGSDAPSTTVR